uniref:Uncharacterized protein n=1 Tax=Rhizophagus irregularis (strain DAOM 181602 / DAOM 197198 / MUCL 43194) TaxID=747089 RepID=U9TPS0_RHIID
MSVYPGQDTLISYLKKQSNKSYRGFLKLHHDIIMNSLTSDLKWYNLDNAWASNYIREAEKIFVDQQELQAYWQRVIKEYEKENLVPKKKSHSKDTIKVLTKDLSETSQKQNQNENYMTKQDEYPETSKIIYLLLNKLQYKKSLAVAYNI